MLFRSSQAIALGLSWAIGFAPIGMLLAGRAPSQGPAAWILAALLYSVWILPLPFLALAVVTALRLDVETAGSVIVLSLWMAAAVTIVWGRIFPTILRHWTSRFSPRPMLAFGRRKFAELLKAWADPRFTIHDKLLWQSRYWVPIPWLLLVNGLILGSALIWLVRWTSELASP